MDLSLSLCMDLSLEKISKEKGAGILVSSSKVQLDAAAWACFVGLLLLLLLLLLINAPNDSYLSYS